MFVNGLSFVIGSRIPLTILAGDDLGGFVGLEAQVQRLLPAGIVNVAQAPVGQHEVVVGLEVFRINGQHLLQFIHGVLVLLFQEVDPADLIQDDPVAWIRCCGFTQVLEGGVILVADVGELGTRIYRWTGSQFDGLVAGSTCGGRMMRKGIMAAS